MSDRIAVMGNGHIEQIGEKLEIFDKPASSYVAKFLGINAFKGKIVKCDDQMMELEANGVLLFACSSPDLSGKNVIATLKPDNIVVSRLPYRNFNGEVGNVVEGRITEMVQMRSNAQVNIDAGFAVKTRIPLNQIVNEGFGVGDKVYVCFSAKSLNVFADTGV